MCPTPQKAIALSGEGGGERRGDTGGRPARPVVIPELCIGCGICETKCPVSGTSAIVVERQAPALAVSLSAPPPARPARYTPRDGRTG